MQEREDQTMGVAYKLQSSAWSNYSDINAGTGVNQFLNGWINCATKSRRPASGYACVRFKPATSAIAKPSATE